MKKNNSLYKTIIKTIVKCTSENETLLDFELIPNEKKKVSDYNLPNKGLLPPIE